MTSRQGTRKPAGEWNVWSCSPLNHMSQVQIRGIEKLLVGIISLLMGPMLHKSQLVGPVVSDTACIEKKKIEDEKTLKHTIIL